MGNDKWYCPAKEEIIEWGLCWEYCFVDLGGPADTGFKLKHWIEHSGKFSNLDDFHKVCEKCVHCQWAK